MEVGFSVVVGLRGYEVEEIVTCWATDFGHGICEKEGKLDEAQAARKRLRELRVVNENRKREVGREQETDQLTQMTTWTRKMINQDLLPSHQASAA